MPYRDLAIRIHIPSYNFRLWKHRSPSVVRVQIYDGTGFHRKETL